MTKETRMTDKAGRNRPGGLGDELVASMREAVEIAWSKAPPGRIYRPPEELDVRAVRRKTGLTQAAFAARFGFTLGAVRDWEQGRRRPEAAARTLLIVIDRETAAVERALGHGIAT
jgi:putative transcriptional regulator